MSNDTFTGNGSATAFTLGAEVTDENNTWVFINGVYQDKSVYSISGTTLTFSTAPQSGYGIEVMKLGNVSVNANALTTNTFTANGSTTAYTLGVTPASLHAVNAYISGLRQDNSTLSLSGNTLTFSTAPPSGASIEIRSIGSINATTIVSPSTVYTVTANNDGGSGTTTITIQVNDVPPYLLSYSGSPFTLTKGSVMTPANPSSSGGDVETWSISPSLPLGLSMNPTTGEISGTPVQISSTTIYTVTATNTGGNTTAQVSITINDVIPSSIVYNGAPYTLNKDSAMVADTPSISGGDVESWSISPSLPTGLSFNTSTGEISGTPSIVSSNTTYSVMATNTGGSATTTITIIVNDAPPSAVNYAGGPFTLEKGTPMNIDYDSLFCFADDFKLHTSCLSKKKKALSTLPRKPLIQIM